ncbi:HAD hydrolase family protein [bacterium]|nr:HAD hydrolase family protein [bacterium]MBU1653074.1 HAD hydrolase family protein [bacterium]MBU1880620.1 HAD hydrolase family protein [bacterium]
MESKQAKLVEKIKPIRLLLMDVDGTLSDGKLTYSNEWVETKSFDVKDGFGIWMLHHCGIKTGIVTGRESKIVTERAKELNIEIVYQGHFHKNETLDDIEAKYGYQDQEVAFLGDDLFDLPIMIRCGFSAAPADAHPEVLQRVDFVSSLSGGRGAAREVCELILKAQGHWDSLMDLFLMKNKSQV